MKKISKLLILLIFLFSQKAISQNWEWLHDLGCPAGFDQVKSFAIDDQGFIYVLGEFSCTATIIDTIFTVPGSNNDSDIFVAKLNPDGSAIWIKQYGSYENEHPETIKVDQAGNIYIGGSFFWDTLLDDIRLFTHAGSTYSSFVAKLNNDGEVLWAAKPWHDDIFTQIRGWDMTIDEAANVYLVGEFSGDMAINGQLYASMDNAPDAYIAKLDSVGNWLWSKTIPNTGGEAFQVVEVDEDQNIYVAGAHSGDLDLGLLTVNDEWDYPGFIAKMDPSGALLWATLCLAVEDLDLDDMGNIYITGNFNQDLVLGTDTLLGWAGAQQAYMAKLDNNGNYTWAQTPEGYNFSNHGYSVHVKDDNNILFAGSNFRNITFDGIFVGGNSYENGYIAVSDPDGNWLEAHRAGGASMIFEPYDVQDYDGGIIAAGIYGGNGNFPPNFSFSNVANGFIASTETTFTTAIQSPLIGSMSISVIPNPASTSWNLVIEDFSLNSNQELQYTLKDMYGRSVKALSSISDSVFQIPCVTLASGLYFLEVYDKGVSTKITCKLIKK